MIPALMQRKSNWKHSGPEVSEEERNELSEMFSFLMVSQEMLLLSSRNFLFHLIEKH